MANWTYTENAERRNVSVSLRNGTLILRIGTYANLTPEEVNSVISSSSGVILKEGIIPPAVPASGGENLISKATFATPWTPKTYLQENQIVFHEGELLRTLRNFTTGEEYVF